MRNRVMWLLFLSIVLLLCGKPANAQSQLNFADYMLSLEDYRLANGLRVILAKDDSAPVVAVNLTYRVGGANDPDGRSGFAHLFEHMMFHGSAHVKRGELDTLLTQIGANFNAYTADDKTVYYTVAPANQLPLILWLESDRLASLVVSQEAFETERQVVIEEYNQRVANAPYGFASRRFDVLPFQGYWPYERPTIGNIDDLNAATLSDVQHFFDTYYAPNNLTLAIVGDMDIEQTQLLVQAYFGKIPAGETPSPILQRHPAPTTYPTLRTDEVNGCQIGYEETIIDPLAELPALWAGVVTTHTQSADHPALSLLANILGQGDSSRLQQNLVQEGKAAFAFANLDESKLGASVLQLGLYPPPGQPVEGVYGLLRGELDKVIAEGVTAEELQRAQQQSVLRAITDFRSDVGNTAEWLQDYALRYDDPQVIPQDIGRFQAVTVEEIQRVAQIYLCDRPLNLVTILQSGEAVQATHPGALVQAQPTAANPLDALPPGVVSRQNPPTPLPASALSVPAFVTFTLDNGLEVIFIEEHKIPEIGLRLYVGGGETALPAAKQGVVQLMSALLTKGTATRTADELAAAIEGIGGGLSGQAYQEFTAVFASGPSTEHPLIFDLLADVTRNPSFPQDQFVLERDQLLAAMKFDASDPDTLAIRQFNRIAYADHPYSYYRTPATINGVTTQDLLAFHTDYYKPNNTLLVITGDLTIDQAKAESERIFGNWSKGRVPNFLDYPKVQSGDSSVIYLIDRPEAEQSTLRLGNLAVKAKSPERYALEIANTVLGGPGLTTRLNQNLREERGYTYGIYSTFTQRNDLGAFVIQSDVGVAHTGSAVAEILRELKLIRRSGVMTDELSDAKGMLIGEFSMGIADSATLARELALRHLYGIPLTEINRYVPTLEQVTASEVLTATRAHIDVKAPIMVVVGDASQIKSQLQSIGKVAVVDATGAVIEVAEAITEPAPPPTEESNTPSDCTCPPPAADADEEAVDKTPSE